MKKQLTPIEQVYRVLCSDIRENWSTYGSNYPGREAAVEELYSMYGSDHARVVHAALVSVFHGSGVVCGWHNWERWSKFELGVISYKNRLQKAVQE